MAFYLIQTLNALSFSVLLMLAGLGLAVVLSLMNFVNLTHGSFFLLGSYIAVYWFSSGMPWWLAFPVAFAATGAIGFLLDRYPFSSFYERTHLMQVLLTFGLSVVFADLMRWQFGGDVAAPRIPDVLRGVVFILNIPFPIYRLFMIVFGFLLAGGLWFLVDRTIWGAVVRACVTDRKFLETLGINTKTVFTAVLALSAGLGGVAGALGSGMLAAHPGLDEEVLLLALIVVVVGGLGTFRGTIISALLLGFSFTFGRVWVPEYSNFIALAVMAALLVLAPQGLVVPKLRRV